MIQNSITDVDFFRGGNAIFTVANQEKHYTFKITKKDNYPFLINLLSGPDNESDYTYVGVYIPNMYRVKLTAKSKFKDESVPVKAVRWAINKVVEKAELPEGYSIQHEGKCCRCGRTLTTPDSINRGIGPECARRM